MAEGVWVEIMKLIKNKQASQVEFIMTIEEINELIMFLKNTRKQFVKRQKSYDGSVFKACADPFSSPGGKAYTQGSECNPYQLKNVAILSNQ